MVFPKLQKEVPLKWKTAPRNLDGFNNSPRREIAAYETQKLFLAPEDYVVSTTLAYCVPMTRSNRKKATIEGTNRELGGAALWLYEVTLPDLLYDESRFLDEPNYT